MQLTTNYVPFHSILLSITKEELDAAVQLEPFVVRFGTSGACPLVAASCIQSHHLIYHETSFLFFLGLLSVRVRN
jgi:hypothetical protein